MVVKLEVFVGAWRIRLQDLKLLSATSLLSQELTMLYGVLRLSPVF
jgi:hypothetical protein